MMRGRWLVFLFFLLLGACLSGATAKACEASAFITNAGNAFLGAARVHSASAFSGATSRYTDLRGIAMFALGPHRKLVSKAREAEYLALTRGFIGRFMATHSRPFFRQRNDHQGLRRFQKRLDGQYTDVERQENNLQALQDQDAAFWCAMSMSPRSGWPSNCAQPLSASSGAMAVISTRCLPICAARTQACATMKQARKAHQHLAIKHLWIGLRESSRGRLLMKLRPHVVIQRIEIGPEARRAHKINNALHTIQNMVIGRVPDIQLTGNGASAGYNSRLGS